MNSNAFEDDNDGQAPAAAGDGINEGLEALKPELDLGEFWASMAPLLDQNLIANSTVQESTQITNERLGDESGAKDHGGEETVSATTGIEGDRSVAVDTLRWAEGVQDLFSGCVL